MKTGFYFRLETTGHSGNAGAQGNHDCLRLNQLAERRRWNPFTDLPWAHAGIHTTRPSQALPCSSILVGFAPYDALSPEQQHLVDHQQHTLEISEILHGETLALLVSGQLVNLLDDPEAKNFAALQAADEARHVSFFRQYMRELNLSLAPPSSGLYQLSVATLQDTRWQHKILCCQVVIESLALAQFSWMKTTDIPAVLRAGLGRLLDDEARHVKFGVALLDGYFRHLPSAEKDCYASYVLNSVMQLSASDNHLTRLAAARHWDPHALRHHLRCQRLTLPALYQARFRQLSLNLRKIGLLTPAAQARLERLVGNRRAV